MSFPFQASSQNTATYASCTARNFFLVLISTLLVHSPSLLSLSYILPYSFIHLHFCPCPNFYLIGSFTLTFVLVLNFTIFIPKFYHIHSVTYTLLVHAPMLLFLSYILSYWFIHLLFCLYPNVYLIGSFTSTFVIVLISTLLVHSPTLLSVF